MNIKETAVTITAVCAVVTLGYGAALRGGWIVDEAGASEIAKQKVEVEERARLEFIREMKYSRLRYLNAVSNKSPDDALEMDTLRDDIKAIDQRLKELKSK